MNYVSLLLARAGAIVALLCASSTVDAQVVALGASNTAGKGVSTQQAYPAQLEGMLRARGYSVNVTNAGISGDTTSGMLARLDSPSRKGRVSSCCSPEAMT